MRRNNQIPWGFTADKLMPVRYYRYTSYVVDRLVEIDTWNRRNDEDLARDVAPFEAIQAKCMATELDVSDSQNGSDYRVDQWDNKVVVCLMTDSGNLIYVGKKDGNWSMGLGVIGDPWITPYEYKHRNLVKGVDGVMYDYDHWKCGCKFRFVHHKSECICPMCGINSSATCVAIPKAYEALNNLYVPDGKYLGVYSKEALINLVEKAYDNMPAYMYKCFVNGVSERCKYQINRISKGDAFGENFLFKLASKLSEPLPKVHRYDFEKQTREKEIFTWIYDFMEEFQ